MSTRTNVVILKENHKPVQLYHHHDGYPTGVGKELQEYIADILKEDKEILSTPDNLAKYLSHPERDDEYELEGRINLHFDIEYLYVISLDEETITCYRVRMWSTQHSDEELIAGDVEDKECHKVYVASFDDGWDDILIIDEDEF